MTGKPLEIEGTWEEILAHTANLAGRRVRLTVLPDDPTPQSPEKPPLFRPASGHSLLRHAGTWAGDDLEECLQIVYDNRGPLEF
ncbi:MAG TPA: hypothetical protein IGS52_16030 [Oscillatoriaceae cyanobacterium M33_DOE_052]|uniref:Uncharacterized protein n=1 Tax=Planktothricoides sp. SpSt-374 TaxID=2282167 RepID=A0A7C3ZW46_9CYAN|nr:hypothetical protein [Oscillatoriaceae cyanobacterium M33_DOE_052]